MNSEYPSPLVIFPEDAFYKITSEIDEFHCWVILQTLNRRNDFREDSTDAILDYYKSQIFTEEFIDLQLQFFLVRTSHQRKNNIRDIITHWISTNKKQFSQYSLKLNITELMTFSRESLKRYSKYYYDFYAYKDYVSQWNNSTVGLNTWKRFSLLSMPRDFQFIAPLFKEEGELKFPILHMRKLFDEYVDELYKQKFKPRLASKILADRDRLILERVIQNIGSKEDKIYLNKQFLNFYSWRIVSENISKCLANEVNISELDINSQTHFANYFALVKYYSALIGEPEKKHDENLAVWFKDLSSDAKVKRDFFEILWDIFDMIKTNCPNASWSDFKGIFNKNGVTTKIEWTGDAEILNYIFRKLYKVLAFNGNKWDVVANYFNRSNKNDTSLNPEKLANNSHFDETKNENLKNRLNDLITTLS